MAEQVEENLWDLIRRTPYRAGQKLPNEYRLSEQFGVKQKHHKRGNSVLEFQRDFRSAETRIGNICGKGMLPENCPLGIKDFEDKEVIALDLVEVRLMIEPAMAEAAA